jgi:hypothetical protein
MSTLKDHAKPDTVYKIMRDDKDGWKVVTRWNHRVMLYGSRAECAEWIEHNARDESL